jgi:biopolymer transport protein ExbD
MASFSGSRARSRVKKEDAELDITSFMNLMIVLVPVLLMMMVFSRITVVELNLPQLSSMASPQEIEQQLLEVEVSERGLDVFFPQGYLVANIPMIEASKLTSSGSTSSNGRVNVNSPVGTNRALNDGANVVHNFPQLQKTLISVKQSLLANGADKKDIVLLLQEDTSYQTIVSLIDTTRSYEDVVVASVVQAELFPQVSLSDAPIREGAAQ